MAERKSLYEKPILERVVLILEENVLGTCMTSGDDQSVAAPYCYQIGSPCRQSGLQPANP